MTTKTPDRTKALAEFDSAPDTSLFNQIVIAHVRECSTATLERDRWAGGGIPFIKIGRVVKIPQVRCVGMAGTVSAPKFNF